MLEHRGGSSSGCERSSQCPATAVVAVVVVVVEDEEDRIYAIASPSCPTLMLGLFATSADLRQESELQQPLMVSCRKTSGMRQFFCDFGFRVSVNVGFRV